MGKPGLIRKAAAAAAIAGIGSPALAADQFDLVCTSTTGKQKVFHVDLNAKQWCFDACGNVLDIANVSPTIIEFIDRKPAFAGDETHSVFVKRMTGEWFEFLRGPVRFGGGWDAVKGTCQPAPFTGFGSEKAKF